MNEQLCHLCTGDHPSWMCVDHMERGALLDEIYKLRKTLLASNKLRNALSLIASPMRPDGTYNRDRAACQKLAEEALR